MTSLDRYTVAARRASAEVIRVYSTSFGTSSRLLPAGVRGDIRSVYALVRVADEIVDGVGTDCGLDAESCGAALDAFEREVLRALSSGFSTDLVVHAFADTARRVGIGERELVPFFASMRRDLKPVAFTDAAELQRYVHGSAEVVGLMCLQCFLGGVPLAPSALERAERGAMALGRAFQLVNFLRDLGADSQQLGRAYLPGIDVSRPSPTGVRELLDSLDADLALARTTVAVLPHQTRPAVIAAHDLFAALSRRIRSTPPRELPLRRIRVPAHEKARIFGRVLAQSAAARMRGASR